MLYGFLHLPTLLAFVDLTSPNREVHRVLNGALNGTVDPDELDAMLRWGPEDRQRDLYLRLGAFAHERKHFHDLLLTPYGNDLVRRSFLYAFGTIQVLVALIHRRQASSRPVIELPLTEASEAPPWLLAAVHRWRDDFNTSVLAGKVTMESSAAFLQTLHVATRFGSAALIADLHWLAYLAEMGNNVALAKHVAHEAVKTAGIDLAEFAPLMLQVFVLALTTGEPDQTLPALLLKVRRASERLSGSQFLAALAASLEADHGKLEAAFAQADQDNERVLQYFQSESLLRNLGPALEEEFLVAFSDFVEQSKRLRDQYLHGPELLVDPAEYLFDQAGRVEPFVYKFAGTELLGFTQDRSWRDYAHDPLLVVTEASTPDGPAWQKTCVPMTVFEHGATMDPVWKQFAVDFGGSIALTEGVDWSDPLEGTWMERVGEAFEVDFVRSFAPVSRGPLPGGRMGSETPHWSGPWPSGMSQCLLDRNAERARAAR